MLARTPLLTTLNLHDRPTHSTVRLWPTRYGIPFPYATGSTPSIGRVPSRGLLYSALFHEVILFSLLFMQVYAGYFAEPAPPPELLLMMDIRHEAKLIYFPSVGGDDEGKAAAEESSKPKSDAAVARKKPAPGMSYPGPQAIVSDSPNPTNRFQTLLQPALENPVVIPPPIQLPNLIQMANAAPLPKMEAPKPPAIPDVRPKPEVKPEPKLAKADTKLLVAANNVPAPISAKQPRVTLPSAAADVMAPPPAPKPVEPPPAPEPLKVAKTAPVPVEGPDKENVLSITPLPSPPEPVVRVPNGEARGRVAISPEPNLTAAAIAPGTKAAAPPAAPPKETSPNNATKEPPKEPVKEPAASSTASTKEAVPESTAVKPKDAETSASPAPPRSPFGGMTITGGRLETGSPGNPASPRTGTITLGSSGSSNASAPTGSYGITIVSTGNSGGGLPDFGVFLHEKAYTVYLDMKSPNGAPRPSWTLQYAVMGASPSVPAGKSNEGIIPPFPATKVQPDFPPELGRKYDRRMIVVYAIMNTEGKLQDLSVKQSPDTQLNAAVLAALGKWIFRPAELGGEPVAVKVLLGIPVSLP